MNRFFTLLLAASCLTAVGQDNLIGEVYLSFQSSYNTVAIEGCEAGLFYVLQIEGTYGVANGSCNRDAAFGNFDNPEPICQWVWNDVCDGCQSNRPSPDTYNSNHSYYYPFVASASEQTFHFQDNGGGGDNCGGLTMRILAGGNAGCTLPIACNYDSEAGYDDGSCLYLDACGECGGDSMSGCIDAYACNFDNEAACDDGSCDYSCCPGPGCCLDGQHWDWGLNGCVITNPSDSNFDGCVQLNDLLDLLSAYGDCGAEESPWLCGDPLEYQGYGYETVQIGEQCWFAENLRSADYLNGEAIQSDLSSESWSSATEGAKTVYGEVPFCFDVSPNFDACNSTVAYAELGHLYNWRAVSDSRGVCPNSWKVPSDEDWTVMIDFVGGIFEGGHVLKATDGWAYNGGGSDSVQFAGLPGGQRLASGDFTGAGGSGFWWSSTPTLTDAWHRILVSDSNTITRSNTTQSTGMSIRCIKD